MPVVVIVPVGVTLPSGVALGWLVSVNVGVIPDVVATGGVIVPVKPGVAPGGTVPVDPGAIAGVAWTGADVTWAKAAWAESTLGVCAEARTANISEKITAQIAKMKTRNFILD